MFVVQLICKIHTLEDDPQLILLNATNSMNYYYGKVNI